jgi:hypothetical protein
MAIFSILADLLHERFDPSCRKAISLLPPANLKFDVVGLGRGKLDGLGRKAGKVGLST